jgi:predicted phosphoribosyltransferase
MDRSNSPKSPFRNRRDAGRQLARALAGYAGHPDVLVLALPRGGVPVAYEVARALDAPLDVFLVRKLGVPGREEVAFGALATSGFRFLNEEVVQRFRIPAHVIDTVTAAERKELQRRRRAYRGVAPPRGQIVILIDDGWRPALRAALAVSDGLVPPDRRHG